MRSDRPGSQLSLTRDERAELWAYLATVLERKVAGNIEKKIQMVIDPQAVLDALGPFTFVSPVSPREAIDFVVDGLRRGQVDTTSPRYFGLFNPDVTTMGIVADAITAAFNPQLGTWNHASFAVGIEDHLVQAFGKKFGYDAACDGTFTSGGAEANHTALIVALMRSFPEMDCQGVRALRGQPVFYVSSESHHSFKKAARACGLGTAASVEVPLDSGRTLDVGELRACIHRDRESGCLPFMVVGTAGTTNAGMIDPIPTLAELCKNEDLWLHVDAAWGGAAALVPELRGVLAGIDRADSITFDAHKWLSVPMGAGMFLTRHADALGQSFHVSTDYMPPCGKRGEIDPYHRSMQWSRRFIGLKLFLSLSVAGWQGYTEVIRHQVRMGELLKNRLAESQWRIHNDTPLPVACFSRANDSAGCSQERLAAVVQEVVQSGQAWVSMTRFAGAPVIRACITSYRTASADIAALVELLNEVWDRHARAGE